MTELRINLSIAGLTLLIAGSIGALAENLSLYLAKASSEYQYIAVEYKLPGSDAKRPIKGTNGAWQTAPAADADKAAIHLAQATEWAREWASRPPAIGGMGGIGGQAD